MFSIPSSGIYVDKLPSVLLFPIKGTGRHHIVHGQQSHLCATRRSGYIRLRKLHGSEIFRPARNAFEMTLLGPFQHHQTTLTLADHAAIRTT